MAKPKKPGKFRYVDDRSLRETFSDSVSNVSFDGTVVRLDLEVHRYTEIDPPKEPSGEIVPVARMVMTPQATIDLFNKLNQVMAAFEQGGLISRKSSPPVRPN